MPEILILLVLSLAVAASPTAKNRALSRPVVLSPRAATSSESPPTIAQIREAARDLQMPSETDAPLRVEFWPSNQSEIAPAQIALFAGIATQNPVETKTVAAFFQNAARVEDWMSDDEKTTAKRFQTLVEVLNANLENPRVYLFGERERNVVIIGKVKGGFGGLVTLVVET